MKFLQLKNLKELAAVALLLSGSAAAVTPIAQAQTMPTLVTQFKCVTSGKDYATIATRGNRVTPPMILWRRAQGGFNAQERCQIVTQNFNEAVRRNGGLLRKLSLTSGVVNNSRVICSITYDQMDCRPDTVLLTLRPDDNPQELLQQIRDFGISASVKPILRAGKPEIYDLGSAVDRFFTQAEASTQGMPVAPVPEMGATQQGLTSNPGSP